LGRGALTLAIDGENLEMVELLVIMGVETRDALLEAINQEFVEAVELLLEHEELIHKEGEPYVSVLFLFFSINRLAANAYTRRKYRISYKLNNIIPLPLLSPCLANFTY
jgi:hypothetical protein